MIRTDDQYPPTQHTPLPTAAPPGPRYTDGHGRELFLDRYARDSDMGELSLSLPMPLPAGATVHRLHASATPPAPSVEHIDVPLFYSTPAPKASPEEIRRAARLGNPWAEQRVADAEALMGTQPEADDYGPLPPLFWFCAGAMVATVCWGLFITRGGTL